MQTPPYLDKSFLTLQKTYIDQSQGSYNHPTPRKAESSWRMLTIAKILPDELALVSGEACRCWRGCANVWQQEIVGWQEPV
jgi:hypothetical protein